MNADSPERDPVAKATADIFEMIASASAVKGDTFAQVTTAWFEALQAIRMIASIRVEASSSNVDVSAKCDIVAHLVGASSSRFAGLLPDGDRDEAMNLAKRLMSILEAAREAVSGAAKK